MGKADYLVRVGREESVQVAGGVISYAEVVVVVAAFACSFLLDGLIDEFVCYV